MTRAEARRQRAQLEKEIARDLKAKARAEILAMRAGVKSARAEKKSAKAGAKAACKTLRVEASARAIAIREEAKRAAQDARASARATCDARKVVAAELGDELARRRAVLDAERQYRRELRRIEAGNRARARDVVRASAKEREDESAGEVEANIPPELVPLWRRVGRSIHGSSRKSRTEAFLEYVDANPDEATGAIEDKTDALIAEMEARDRGGVHYARGEWHDASRASEAGFSKVLPMAIAATAGGLLLLYLAVRSKGAAPSAGLLGGAPGLAILGGGR